MGVQAPHKAEIQELEDTIGLVYSHQPFLAELRLAKGAGAPTPPKCPILLGQPYFCELDGNEPTCVRAGVRAGSFQTPADTKLYTTYMHLVCMCGMCVCVCARAVLLSVGCAQTHMHRSVKVRSEHRVSFLSHLPPLLLIFF